MWSSAVSPTRTASSGWKTGRLRVRISDLLAAAPAPVMEALAHILLGKLYRKPVARLYNHRYRLYLNRRDMRRQAHLVRQIRGRKFVSGPTGRGLQSGGGLRATQRAILRRVAGNAAFGLEPWRFAQHAGPFRPVAQCHYHQPDIRSAGPPGCWHWST